MTYQGASLKHITLRPLINLVHRRGMPVNVPPTATGKRRFRLPVETDPHKLVNYVCGLNYKKDQPPIKLGSDSDYPEWLWSLRLDAPKPSWELERGTKEYYERLALEGKERANQLAKRQKKPIKVVGEQYLRQMEWLHHIRFRALAYLDEDYSVEADKIENEWNRDNIRQFHTKSEFYLPPQPGKIVYKDKLPNNLKYRNIAPRDPSQCNHRVWLKPYTYKSSVSWPS